MVGAKGVCLEVIAASFTAFVFAACMLSVDFDDVVFVINTGSFHFLLDPPKCFGPSWLVWRRKGGRILFDWVGISSAFFREPPALSAGLSR